MAYGDDKPVFSKMVGQEIEVETPMGLKVFTYGDSGYYDSIRGKYRTEEVQGNSVASLLVAIQRVEEEFQVKKARDDKRKAVAKAPEEAVLFLPATTEMVRIKDDSRRGYHMGRRAFPARLEDVHVRGVDMRSGSALVTRADGSRESVEWGAGGRWNKSTDYSGRVAVLRPLTAEERAEIIAAQRVLDRAAQEAKKHETIRLSDVLGEVKIELEVHYDPETGQRYADWERATYRGDTKDHVEAQVYAVLATKAGYPYNEEGELLVEKAATDVRYGGRVTSYTTVQPNLEVIEARKKANGVLAEAHAVLSAILTDLLFDKTLGDGAR